MIIKRISCKVKEGQKEIFYEYQKQWEPLSKVKGFLGQLGGWSEKQPLTACVYSFWESQADYQYFMKEVHDRIYVNSGQESSFTSIDVNMFQEELRISGLEESFANVLRNGNFIRVSLSQVKEQKTEHFVEMQKKVWNFGLRKAEEMLGGTFSFSQKESNYFLVLSVWKSEKFHQKYMELNFPELIETAKPKNDVLELVGEKFKVEEAWRVSPTVPLINRNFVSNDIKQSGAFL
ncbi:YdbC family protein [Neobacillus sp. PS3-12]|uniref:YdbC family protein n=1 Tax=Neobacillus sp. PS3-12 TaxID=3070677 RepID=UPI0027E0A111|nr:YdbC family protein [Neobacillus sp. PS3-12]WML52273.1 YdbC family protein [Neobacillus sp. PS3-12]